ncbi:CAP domain-containing protein [Paracoccus sp. NSM]|uniref:CAP domain-containing protein n=1 Tax=Paracoccus sp. NSM TaxID=3457784 RepID=UPI00403730C7
MPGSRILPLMIAAASLALPLLVTVPHGASAAQCTATPPEQLSAALEIINRNRSARGATPVTPHPALIEAASRQACQMARQGRLSHGAPPVQRLRAAGYRASIAAENIGAGPGEEGGMIATWMQSSPHRANLVNRRLRDAGLARATDANGQVYWALILAAPR